MTEARHEVRRGSARISPRQRIACSAFIALITFVAPILLVWLVEPGFDWPGWWVAIGAAMIVPPFVFQLLSRPDPDWGYGLAFAIVPSLALAIVVGFLVHRDPEYPGGAAWLIFSVVLAFVAVFLVGMVGASIASLVARPFNLENPLHRPQRLQAWHVGAMVAAVDVVAVVAVAAASI